MTMDNTQVLALIERAEREMPFCDCGQPMAPVALGREIWLECTSERPLAGRGMRRLLAAVASARHTRRLIVDPVDLG
jgi:hypothetical protein